MPVGFYLGTVGDFESYGTKQLFDTFQGTRNRMQSATRHAPPGQRHIKCFGGKLRLQGSIAQSIAPRLQGGFHLFLGRIDGGAGSLALIGGQFAQALQLLGQQATLAEIAGLRLFEFGRLVDSQKLGNGRCNELIECIHTE